MVIPQKLQGPASYFPSIEKRYGQPIAYWIDLAGQKKSDETHGDRAVAQSRTWFGTWARQCHSWLLPGNSS
jgi:hypothetical protein